MCQGYKNPFPVLKNGLYMGEEGRIMHTILTGVASLDTVGQLHGEVEKKEFTSIR